METVIRVIIFYLFILIGLRFMGKREFSQMSPLELVSLLLIPELVAQSIVGEDFSIVNGIIAISTLFALVYLNSTLIHHSPTANRLIVSTPTVLVDHGEYVTDNMNRERVSPDEIKNEMHKSGLERLSQVKWAILETDGKISIIDSGGKDKSDQHDEGSAV
jgi:uncharacterized membrane protein YcaP (DUF421 family)